MKHSTKIKKAVEKIYFEEWYADVKESDKGTFANRISQYLYDKYDINVLSNHHDYEIFCDCINEILE